MTDSRLSSGLSTHSARAVHGGKITAQNPALLQMLREKTLEKEKNSSQADDEPVRRLYVESPVFTKEDEENIQFVSSDVEEDFRDSLEDGGSSNSPKGPESVNDMPSLIDLISKTEVLKSRQNTNASQFSKSGISNPSAPFDSSRYEDLQGGGDSGDLHSEQSAAMLSKSKKSGVGHVGQEKVWHALRNGEFDSRNTSASTGKSVNFRSTHTEIPDIAEDAEPDIDESDNKENVPHSDEHAPRSANKVITPIQNPLRGLSKEQTEEMQLLEEEERYQRQLQMKIEDETHEAENIHIPKLDLDEVVSDDDDQREKKVTEMGLLDSLASTERTVEGENTLRDSLEQPSGNSLNWEKKYHELEERLGKLEKDKDNPPLQPKPYPGHPRMTSGDLKNLQDPALSQGYSREFQFVPDPDRYVATETTPTNAPQRVPVQTMSSKGQPGYRGQLPLNFAQESGSDRVEEPSQTVYPQGEQSQEPEQYYDQPLTNTNAPPQALPRQQYSNEQPPYEYPTEQYQAEPQYEGGYISQHPQKYYEGQPYPDQYPDEQYHPQQQYANEQAPAQDAAAVAEQQPNEFYLNGHQPNFKGYKEVDNTSPTPAKDYISYNKQVLRGEVGSAKTYGKKYVQKKEYSERPPPAPPVRKKKPAATPVAPNASSVHAQSRVSTTNISSNNVNNLHQKTEETVVDDENLTPEQRWAKRAQVLSNKKDQQTGQTSKPQSKASLRKYPSVSKVDELKQTQARPGTYNKSVPQSLQGSAQQRQTQHGVFNPAISPPRQAFQERGVSTGKTYTLDNNDRNITQNGQNPVLHSLVTGDGQKLDVDINVKVLNPPANYPPAAGRGVVPGSRTVSQGQRPTLPQSQQSQHGHESPLQIQSVNSSAGTVRHPAIPVNGPPVAGYAQPRSQPPPPQHAPYNGPGYHYPASQPQHYHYSAPEHIQNGGQGDYNQQQYHPLTRGPNYHPDDPRYGPRQPPHQQQYHQQQPQQHPSVFGPAAPGRPIPQARGPSQNKPHGGYTVPTQPMQAFQPFQESFDNYDQGYSQPEYFEASGATSPSSFRGGYDITPTPGNMSPYKVVPPIGSAEESVKKKAFTQYNTTTSKDKPTPRTYADDVEVYSGRDRGGAGGSYMDNFEKNKSKKRVLTYKPYTLNDFRKMKKEVRLGGLGPDLDKDSVKEKKEKLQRQLNYAKSINERNREEYELEKAKPRPQTYTKDTAEEEDDVIDKRRLALEYAKSVPKPKVRPADEEEPDSNPSSASMGGPGFKFVPGKQTNSMKTVTTLRAYPAKPDQNRGGLSGVNDRQGSTPLSVTANQDTDSALIDLDALQQRHQQEREKVAMIRQNMQVS